MTIFINYPIKNMDLNKINSPFGMRTHPITKVKTQHNGIDYPAPAGTPVLAVADGVVSVSKMQGNGKGYGNYVVITHVGGSSIYAHLRERIAYAGQKVKAGQTIGTVGTTGSSTGNHLHFGVCGSFSSNSWYDPLPALKKVSKQNITKEVDDEVIDKTKVLVNGKTVEVERILKNGTNYIRLRDFEDVLGIVKIGYDADKKLPIINKK